MKFTGLLVAVTLVSSLMTSAPAGAQTGFFCEGQPATLVGSEGDDVLIGTRGVDVIVALGGDDVIRSRAGDDLICAGDGDDLVWGNNGADLIFGGAGEDVLRGNRGKDAIFGGADGDEIRGGKHDDVVRGGAGNDRLRGGNGVDYLDGDSGQDALFGDMGRDFLHSYAADEVDGGEGSDTVLSDGVVIEGDPHHHQFSEPAGFVRPSLGAPDNSVPACSQQALYDHFVDYEPTGLLEDQLLLLLNEARAFCGLQPLAFDPTIGELAEGWSDQLQRSRASGEADWLRHTTRDYRSENGVSGENLAWTVSQRTPRIHTLLIASGGHFCNFMNPQHARVGIGVTSLEPNDGSGLIATFMFAGYRPLERPFSLHPVHALEYDDTPVFCQYT